MIRHYKRLKLHIQYSILKKQNHVKIEIKRFSLYHYTEVALLLKLAVLVSWIQIHEKQAQKSPFLTKMVS